MRTKTDDRPERRDGIGIRRASFPLPKQAPNDGRAARCRARRPGFVRASPCAVGRSALQADRHLHRVEREAHQDDSRQAPPRQQRATTPQTAAPHRYGTTGSASVAPATAGLHSSPSMSKWPTKATAAAMKPAAPSMNAIDFNMWDMRFSIAFASESTSSPTSVPPRRPMPSISSGTSGEFHEGMVGIMYARPVNTVKTSASTATTRANGLRAEAESLPARPKATYSAMATKNTMPTAISLESGEWPMPANTPTA